MTLHKARLSLARGPYMRIARYANVLVVCSLILFEVVLE